MLVCLFYDMSAVEPQERNKACLIIIHFTLNHKVSHIKWRLNYKSKAKSADVVNHIASMQVNNATAGYGTGTLLFF